MKDYLERIHRRNSLMILLGFLTQCDGLTDIAESELVSSFVARRFITLCEKGKAALVPWQKQSCDNRYFPAMNCMITGRCNYNCLHWFNASDNSPLVSEFSKAESEKLLDEARECGINAFTITGGEPMCHNNFFEILEGNYKRDMYVEELNTNGFYITQKSLDSMKQIGCNPLIKISFDDLGHHDWLRNRKVAVQLRLRLPAIRWA